MIASGARVGHVSHYLGNVEHTGALQHVHPISGPVKNKRRAPLSITDQADIIALIYRDLSRIILELRTI